MQTQWRATGFGIVGLDYGALHMTADLLGIDMTQGLFAKIRALEMTVLKKQREQKADDK